jgi:hypothetical protein
MAAGGEEQAVGKRRPVGQALGEGVRLEVIDRDQRRLVDERNRLGGGEADDHTADQSGAGGSRDAVELREFFARLRHRLGDDEVEHLDRRAAIPAPRAEGGMLIDLRYNHSDWNRLGRPAVRPRRPRSVAGRLDPEHEHRNDVQLRISFRPGPSRMIAAVRVADQTAT